MGTMKRTVHFALVMLIATGCGASRITPGLEGGSWGEVDAPAPSATEYRTESSPGPVIGEGDRAAVEAAVRDAGAVRGVVLEGDGRLALLAAWISEHIGEGGALPPAELTAFFAHHLGLVDPTPHLLTLAAGQERALPAGVRDSVGRFLDRQPYQRFGVALVRREGTTLAVVALSERRLTLRPVPRSIPEGASLVIQGTLAEGLSEPRVVLAMPGGETRDFPVGSGNAFQVNLPTAARGRHRVEISAKSGAGRVLVAEFPVFAGEEPPSSIDLSRAAPDEAMARSPEDFAAALLQQANEARRQAGLPPLEAHEVLAEVSRRHSEDMAEHGFFAHESPRTGSPAARTAAAGIESGLILENLGRGSSPAEVHRGFMQSPGQRANLLNAGVTHVGIGVVPRPQGERTEYVVTAVFVSIAAEIDPAAAASRLLMLVNEARRARGAPSLQSDENLREAAQRSAELYFEDPSRSQQDVVDSASAEVRGLSLAFRRVGGLMALASQVEEAAQLEPALDPSVRYVGIGVAQGTRPGRPPNSLAVVILMAWPR